VASPIAFDFADDITPQRRRPRVVITRPTNIKPRQAKITVEVEPMIDLPVGNGRLADERGFVHKKILGLVGKVAQVGAAVGLPGASTVAKVSTFFRGGGRGQGFVPRTELPRGITIGSEAEKRGGALAKGLIPDSVLGRCIDPRLVMAPDGHCVAPGSGHFREHFGGESGVGAVPVGEAVMGRYGAALRPGSMVIDRAVCLKGMQLGNDGLCYNKSQISNKQRQWPAGRKPLLSGGDMRAISIAARAGRRLEGATKRLQKLGMMKKPASGRRALPAHQHAKQIAAVSV